MTALELGWMRDDAPYMPIATQGLLSVLAPVDPGVQAWWAGDSGTSTLRLQTALSTDAVALAILDAPLPDVTAVDWPTNSPQALGPSLLAAPGGDPLGTYHALLASAGPVEQRLLRAIATDQVLDAGGGPSRTRLLRGAKSDLSAFGSLRRTTAAALAGELRHGPDFRPGKSGAGLGLVPEVQTFGGTTGRKADQVGAESALLSRLLRHGILALPPTGCLRRGRRDVGGPLIGDDRELSWPRWTIPCGPRALRLLFGLACVHADEHELDPHPLRASGIGAVFRARPQQLSTTVAVFRWGRRVS
jgi:hypothetical protein